MNQFEQQGPAALDAAAMKRVSFGAPGGMNRPKSAAPPKEFHWRSLGGLRVLSAEFFATMLLVFCINASVVSISRSEGPALLQTAAAIGLAYATLVHTFGHVSGAHMNPAVTVALLSARKINIVQAILYIIVQSKLCCAFGVAHLPLPYGTQHHPSPPSTIGAIAVQFVFDFVLTPSTFDLQLSLASLVSPSWTRSRAEIASPTWVHLLCPLTSRLAKRLVSS